MGLRPDHPDYEEGLECLLCVDLLFNGLTPKYVEADISGIQQCLGKPAVPEDCTILLTQIDTCKWLGHTDIWDVEWNLLALNSQLFIVGAGMKAFTSQVNDDCYDAFVNLQSDCVNPMFAGFGGYVLLYWGPTIGP